MRRVLLSERAELSRLATCPCFQKVNSAGGCQKVGTAVAAGRQREAASWEKEVLRGLLAGLALW